MTLEGIVSSCDSDRENDIGERNRAAASMLMRAVAYACSCMILNNWELEV
jgi:hypothetical protein